MWLSLGNGLMHIWQLNFGGRFMTLESGVIFKLCFLWVSSF